jgi:hypothetical protein
MAKQRRENGLNMGVLQAAAIPGNARLLPYKEGVAGSTPASPTVESSQHETSSFLSETYGTMQLIRANPILAGAEHPHGSEPLIQPDRIFLKDGSDLDRDLLLAGPATPEW